MNDRERLLAEGSLWPLIFRFSTPAILGMLVNALYNVVDRFYIGRVPVIGPAALTGLGVAFPILSVGLAFTLLFGIGAAANISLSLGRKDRAAAERVLGNTVTASAAAALVLTVLGIVFADNLLRLFGASDVTLEYASAYLKTYLLGTVFVTTGIALNHSIRGSGSPMVSALTQVLGAVLNIILDPIFIFVFGLGVRGAAIATVISQVVSFLWVMGYILSKKSLVKIRRANLLPRWNTLWSIFSIGASPFALQLAASAVSIVANRTLKFYGGDDAIGAMTIMSSLSLLFLMPLFGLNQGLQPILGFNYGAKNYARVRQALKKQIILASVYVAVCFCAVLAVPQLLVRFFVTSAPESANLFATATAALRVLFLGLPLLGVVIPVSNYFQSVGKASVAIVMTLLRQVILLIPLYLLLPVFFGLDGIWFALPSADTASFLITAFVLFFEARRLRRLEAGEEPAAAPAAQAGTSE